MDLKGDATCHIYFGRASPLFVVFSNNFIFVESEKSLLKVLVTV